MIETVKRDNSISARLAELRGYAVDDFITINEKSIEDFLTLMNSNDNFSLPAMFLEDNGDITITWHKEKRLSVRFFGSSKTEIVYFMEATKKHVSMPVITKYNLDAAIGFIKNHDLCLTHAQHLERLVA